MANFDYDVLIVRDLIGASLAPGYQTGGLFVRA